MWVMYMNNEMNNPQYNGLVQTENVGAGVIGAIIGSLAGVVAIILFGMLGFVASIAGAIMAYACFALYEKFAKGLSKTGVIICIIIIVIMTVLGVCLSLSIQIAKELNVGIGDVIGNFFSIINYNGETMGAFLKELGLVYLFSALGCFSIIKTKFKSVKNN